MSESVVVPEEVALEASKATSSLLPRKSKSKYEKEFEKFCEWRRAKGVSGVSEDIILAYMSEKAKQYSSSTLWAYHSMLKSTLLVHEKIDINNYAKVHAFLKRQNVCHEPKKSRVLTMEELTRFIMDAPDSDFLLIKIVTIFGICGACRCDEMYQMTMHDIEDKGAYLHVRIPSSHSKTHKGRHFTILSEGFGVNPLELFRKYLALRPKKITHKSLFVFYKNGKCSVQRVGINSFYRYPKLIAKYLNLADPENYTGHCYRRSSTTLLANAGADVLRLKRHGGWRSSSIAEGYVEDSVTERIDINKKIVGAKSTSASTKFNLTSLQVDSNVASASETSAAVEMDNTGQLTMPKGIIFQHLNNCTFNINITNNSNE